MRATAAVALAAWLVGCGAPGPLIPEQQPRSRDEAPVPPAPANYRVARGDTLYSIAFRYGLDWREIAAWNAIGAPYTIRVGDRLRLRPPPDMRPAAVAGPGDGRRPEAGSRPVRSAPEAINDARPDRESPSGPGQGESGRTGPSEPAPEAAGAAAGAPAATSAPVPDAATRSVAGVGWRWPTAGRVIRRFDASATRKGILIAGEAGQPIRAAAGGEVVYSGNGLIGYGELVIIKHSERMLSAYAHNRERLVSEGDRVGAGALIGRMGRDDRDRVALHFEIRRNGKPDDPLDYLPPR